MIDVDILDTTYQYIITTFLLNTMLHHVGMLCIIETHEQLQYDMEEQNLEWMTVGQWYNTSTCKKLHGILLRVLLQMQELTDMISCVLLMHIKKSINHLVIMSALVGVFHHQQIQQQKYYICSVQPYILSISG